MPATVPAKNRSRISHFWTTKKDQFQWILWFLHSSNTYKTFKHQSWECPNPFDTNSKCLRNIHVLQDSRRRLGGQEESWQAFCQPINFKLAGNIPGDGSTLLTPSPNVSGTSMSSKTLGGILEDRRSLDRLFVNQSTSNLQETFLGIVQPSWHHLQVCQEHPCPPRLQEDTWRTGGVLMPF